MTESSDLRGDVGGTRKQASRSLLPWRLLLVTLSIVVAAVIGLPMYSRVFRGTWDVSAKAERIDLANGYRFYPNALGPTDSPDLAGFEPTGTIAWPDRAVYAVAGPLPHRVWVRMFSGLWWEYDRDFEMP